VTEALWDGDDNDNQEIRDTKVADKFIGKVAKEVGENLTKTNKPKSSRK
jgi:hypothetical protein